MRKCVIPLLVLAYTLALWARAQDIVPAAVPVAAGTPLPSSVRASVPTSPTDPGTEGQLAMDDRALYSYHAGRWCWSPRINFPVPTPAPKPTSTP